MTPLDDARQLLAESSTLFQQGQFAEAASKAQKAVAVLRGFQPPADKIVEYLKLFGEALHTLAIRLIHAGRVEEAKQPAQQAVDVYRRLAAASGADVTLASQELLSVSSTLSGARLHDEAAAAAQAAGDVLRETVSYTPDIDAIGLLPRDSVVRSQ